MRELSVSPLWLRWSDGLSYLHNSWTKKDLVLIISIVKIIMLWGEEEEESWIGTYTVEQNLSG